MVMVDKDAHKDFLMTGMEKLEMARLRGKSRVLSYQCDVQGRGYPGRCVGCIIDVVLSVWLTLSKLTACVGQGSFLLLLIHTKWKYHRYIVH